MATIAGVSDWNLADVWETVAAARPAAPAQSQGERRTTWAEFDARADGVAAGLLAVGLGRQAKVAQYLQTVPEYLESFFGALKAGMVPVNTNFRYTVDELVYLWDNADAEVVIFDGSFSDGSAGAARGTAARRSRRGGGSTTTAPPARRGPRPTRAAARTGPGRRTRGPWGRSGDDLILVYTGGTTGMPKGVMWRQDDLFVVLNRTGRGPLSPRRGRQRRRPRPSRRRRPTPPPGWCPAPPLMHGTGLFTAMLGAQQRRVHRPAPRAPLVGRASCSTPSPGSGSPRCRSSATPSPARLLAELDAHPGRWDLSSLWLVISSGVMWSAEVKAGLLRHHARPGHGRHAGLVGGDRLGQFDHVTQGHDGQPAASASAPSGRVIAEDGREVTPGSGELGLVAIRGRTPIGYYKDEAKTAGTFRIIDGERWSIPGRLGRGATPTARVRLLGRGSVVHQHRRREGVPRGGGGDPQGAIRRSTTPSSSGSPTSASARWSWAWSSP